MAKSAPRVVSSTPELTALRGDESKTVRKSDLLRETLSAAKGEPLVILISGHPDPDAIGSALAHKLICQELGVPATIAHVLPVSRPENRALVKLLDVDLVQLSETEELEQFRHLSLVDTSSTEPSLELPEHLKPLTIVDHHRGAPLVEAPFMDIRPTIGATCTIYAEYLQDGIAPLRAESKEDARIATALLFGIETDTDDFSAATQQDFLAAAFLKPLCDVALSDRFGHRTVAAEAMDAIGRALVDMEVVRDFALAGVGRVSPRNRDAIASAADFIVRREDIDTVVVYGLVDGRIDGSLRTKSASVDPAQFLRTAFGEADNGRPYGGGRAEKGGFQVPIGMLADTDDTEGLWRVVQRVVRKRLARVIQELDPPT